MFPRYDQQPSAYPPHPSYQQPSAYQPQNESAWSHIGDSIKRAIPGGDTFSWHKKFEHIGEHLALEGVPHSAAGVANIVIPEDATEQFFSGSTSVGHIVEGLFILITIGFLIAMLVEPDSVGYKAGFGIFLTISILMGINMALRSWFMTDNRWLNFIP